MIKNLKYSKELLSELLNLDRKELYILEKTDNEMYEILIVGSIILLEQSNRNQIPFSDLSEALNRESKTFSEREDWTYKNVNQNLILEGKNLIEQTGLTSKDLLEYIYFRNLKQNVLNKFYEDLEDRTEMSRDLFL